MANRRNVRDLERKARRAADALDELVAPSGVSRRGSVLADLIYRAGSRATADGFPSSSGSAAPALSRPSSQHGLRTNPEDALRRKREHGYSEGSSVENAVEAILEDVCDRCGGSTPEGAPPCKDCGGTGRRFHDPIYEAVEELIEALEQVAGLVHKIDKKRQIVLHARDAAPSETRAENCHGCHRKVYGGRADPIRRGLCNKCATAYYVWRATDDHGTDDESADRARWCAEVGPTRRHEDHDERLCDQCAEDRRKAGDEWRLDRADEMRRSA